MGWIILGAVLLFLLLLLLLPARVCFTYRTEPQLTVWAAFVPIRLIPAPEKPKKPKAKKPKPDRSKAKSDEKSGFLHDIRRDGGLSGLIAFLQKAIRLALWLVGRVAKRLVIEKLDLRVSVAAGDSAQTATLYGKVCAGIYPAVELLSTALGYESIRTEVVPNFMAEQSTVQCTLRIRLRLIWPVCYGLRALLRFVKLIIRQKCASRKATQTSRSLPERERKKIQSS